MRRALLGFAALLISSPGHAQLAGPNEEGVAFAHVHLSVTDLDLHKALWVDMLGGVLIEKVGYAAVQVPGALVFFTEREPSAPSVGTVVDHVGFKVRDLGAVLAWWRDQGYPVDDEWLGGEGLPQAYIITMPNGTETTADVPGTNLSFGQAASVTSTEGTAIDHIGFEVDDINAFAEMLRGRGVEFELEPFHVESLDIWVAFFFDPAGTRVEISQGLDDF